MSIGETLAQRREESGLSVTEVSRQTRIRETVIRGIERDDFASCGGNFYARGHIRSIARVVGAEAEPLVREYDESHGGAPQPVSVVEAFEAEKPVRIRERSRPNWTGAMAGALVLVVVLYTLSRVLGGDGGQPARQNAVPAAKPTPSASTAAPPSGDSVAQAPRKTVQLRVKATRSSWLNVRDDSGKQIYSGLLRAGQSKEWTSRKRLRVLIGNGGGVRLAVNGKDLGSPGTDGQVLRLSFGPGDPENA